MDAFNKIFKTPTAFVLLLVALVSLVGTIVKSKSDEKIARIPIEATQTAEAGLVMLPAEITAVSPTQIPSQEVINSTSTPEIIGTPLLSARSIAHRQIEGSGTIGLILTSNQIMIGTADRFDDVMDITNPPFTIFAIYGETSTHLRLFWGGWDLWENASEEFVDSQLEDKINEVISGHPDDYQTRGYRVIKCYGQVISCEILQTYP